MRRALVRALIALATVSCNPRRAAEDSESKPTAATSASHGVGVVDDHQDEPEHASLSKKVRLTDAVILASGIETHAVALDAIGASLELPGEIAADQNQVASIGARVAGHVEAITARDGERVKKGAPVATIRSSQLGATRAEYVALVAKASAAKLKLDREELLFPQHATSESELFDARAAFQTIDAERVGAAEKVLALGVVLPNGSGALGAASLLQLTAPIDGTVITRSAIAGQSVTAEQPLMLIANLDEVWFLARLFERNLARVRVGSKAEVRLNAYPDERFAGNVESIGQQVDPVARTVVARVRLKNRGELLRIGLFGAAIVDLGDGSAKAPPGLVVPRDAIVDVAGKPVVFVREGDGDFALHEVTLGASGVGKVAVLSGLRVGENVVTRGAFTLKSVVLKSTMAGDD
jgi:cobalt-zinc-cadmium efflux system membrane fusion protein